MWLCLSTLDQSPIAKSTPTVKEFCSPECRLMTYRSPQSGMTSLLLMDETSTHELILSTEVFPAKTSVLQDMEKAWTESEADFFSRSCAWPKKSSPNFYSLRTQKESCQTEESKLLKRLPPSGIAAVGLLRAVKRLDHPKIVKDGFVWPTPTARATRDCPAERKRKSPSIESVLNQKNGTTGLRTSPNFLEWIMTYPLGWTELAPWAIPYVLSKRGRRLKS